MGDASFPQEQAHAQREDGSRSTQTVPSSAREVHVLVTGFGSFKSFSTNPSYLIATNLSTTLDPYSPSATTALLRLRRGPQQPIRDADPRPYTINVHVYPDPIRVAYDVVREFIPSLVADSVHKDLPPGFIKPEHGYDYILHIGMAAGRENYTLETIGHRDHYKLKDVDDLDGSRGEIQWRAAGLPDHLDVGWNKEEVLTRWEALVRRREDEFEHEEMTKAGWKEGMLTLVETARLRSQVFLGKGKRATVKLSRDAGRYLCEFIFYTSLGTRWKEARDAAGGSSRVTRAETPSRSQRGSAATEKVGKVGFLHVPGGTERHDIARGVRAAESAILALVGSWEDGYRNSDVYGSKRETQEGGGGDRATPVSMYEARGTGDR